jgi:WD40 repeat protein
MWMRTCVVLLASILVSSVSPWLGRAADKDAAPRKTAVFYLPSKPIVLDKKTREVGRNGDLLLRKGAEVQCVGGTGACFIEAGASLSTVGGTHVFIIKKGGTLSQIVGGKHRIYCEKGTTIDPRIARQYPIVEFDTISFEPFQTFTLKGTVQDAHGKSLEGIKVHVFGLGGERLSETTTDRAGAFEFRPSKQVRWLLADLGTEWIRNPVFRKDRDLEFCRRVRMLRGWETEIREGLWGRDATVPIVHDSRDGLTLPPPTCLLGHEAPIQAMAFSGDSASLVTVSFAGRPCLWNVKTGKEVRKLLLPHAASRDLRHAPNNPWPIALDADGKVLAFSRSSGIQTDVAFGLWDLATGKQVHELNGHKRNVQCAVFSPDGRTLASGGADGTIRLWEVSSGKTPQVITAHKDGVTGLRFTRDGKQLLSMGRLPGGDNNNISFPLTDAVRVWDISTGHVVRTFPGEADFVVFSLDGRRLAGAGAPMRYERIPPNGFRIGPHPQMLVWDSESGRQVMKLLEKADTLAFTRDGLLLLAATGESIRIWEVDSGQEILTCPLPQKDVSKVAFSPNGRTLAVGQQDGAVYLWTVRAHHLYVPEDKPRSDVEWEKLWGDLASEKAATAYRALWTLLREPPRAVTLLKTHLRPMPRRELPLDKWIVDLDNEDFAKRQAAAKALREAGEPAERALRRAQGSKPSLEARKRIEQLLEEIGQRRLSVEELRSLRAIQLLEEIGSPEARQLLQVLAKGWSEARQTREAKAALKRLHREARAAKDAD